MREYLLVLTTLSIGILFEVCPLVPLSKGAMVDAQGKPSTKHLAVRCGKLLDGKNAGAVSDAVVLIEGDRIVAVGRGLKIPAGAEVIDLSRETVLPGLIDTHTHLTYHYDTEQNEKPAVTALYSGENARSTNRDLHARIATIREFIRKQISAGADVIKVFVTPGAGGGDVLLYSQEEIKAIVDEASKAHLKEEVYRAVVVNWTADPKKN